MKTGVITELELQTELSRLGAIVSIPYGDYARYDHIWDINGTLLKVQIKSSQLISDESGFKFPGKNTAGKYTEEQIDGIATAFNGKCYYVPIDKCSNEIKLRFTLPSNSKQKDIMFAHDYELHRILKQLIEKNNEEQQ